MCVSVVLVLWFIRSIRIVSEAHVLHTTTVRWSDSKVDSPVPKVKPPRKIENFPKFPKWREYNENHKEIFWIRKWLTYEKDFFASFQFLQDFKESCLNQKNCCTQHLWESTPPIKLNILPFLKKFFVKLL